MNEIRCPHCGKAFTVDESGYAAIVQQVRDREFDKRVSEEKNAAVVVDDYEMADNPTILLEKIRTLIHSPRKRADLADALALEARSDAASTLADIILGEI